MMRISIEVCSGTAQFVVLVRALSIRRAVRLVAARYPSADVRVRFPIDPEGFFVKDRAARAGLIEHDQPEPAAA
jgi:hypothetical protein